MEKNQKSTLSVILGGFIRLYRVLLSPVLGPRCRFYPSCSEYWLQALQQHRFTTAVWLGVKRLAKCHPGHPGGYDAVPPATEINKKGVL